MNYLIEDRKGFLVIPKQDGRFKAPHLINRHTRKVARIQQRQTLMAGRSAVPCHYCGVSLTAQTATRDHVVPLARGGADDLSNIVLACERCNTAKGSRPYGEFIGSRA